ncbi:MAG TPA: hypothetical protein VFY73_02700 [Ideonella sp.]|uniref:hypothetical protein n=1 Tax=Ideonella sp. TaxID=1929293 RepID=UPI002E315B85|nr:hypothetical protein [Ideonella sp.]HEX5682921.1 hypothetical protein [Ideonella sp.]
MKQTTAAALAALTLGVIGPLAAAGELADAAVAKELGVSGVTHKTTTRTWHGKTYTDVAYKDGRGGDLFALRLGTADQYSLWKHAMGTVSTPVTGVGDEAFQVKNFRAICARSASSAVCVTPSFVNKNLTITDQQIQALVSAAL